MLMFFSSNKNRGVHQIPLKQCCFSDDVLFQQNTLMISESVGSLYSKTSFNN